MIKYDDLSEKQKKIISAEDFDRFIDDAERIIHFYTFSRIEKMKMDDHFSGDIYEKFKSCAISLMKMLKRIDEKKLDDKKGIASERVGDYSVSFDTGFLNDLTGFKNRECYLIVREYFAHTGLMYRGI